MSSHESRQQQLLNPDAESRFFYGTSRHAWEFLGETIKGIEQASMDAPTTMRVGLNEGLTRGVFIDTVHSSNLDLGALGLPHAPNGQKVHAVILRENSEYGPAVELLTTPVPDGKETRIREVNIFVLHSQNTVTSTNQMNLQWAYPGNSHLSGTSNVKMTCLTNSGADYLKVDNIRKEKGFDNSIAGITLQPGDEGKYVVIRAMPTKSERDASFALSPHTQAEAAVKHGRRMEIVRKVAGILMAASAAVGFGAAVGPSELPQDRIVETAHDLVGDRTTSKVNGKPQAEQRYDETTLARSRTAIEAYMKGDLTGLQQLKEQGGYEDNWISEQAIKNLSNAENFDELEIAFNKLFPNKNILLDIPKRSFMINAKSLDENDLEKAKITSQQFLSVMNAFDRKYVSAKKLKLQLVKELKDDDDDDIAGQATNDNDRYFSIRLDVDQAIERTSAHEFMHSVDQLEGGALSARNAMLNPTTGTEYVGKDWVMASMKDGRYEIAARDYGRKNHWENWATIGEAWFGRPGDITLDRSPVGEKMMNYLFLIEDYYPGATASFLLNARPNIRTQASVMDNSLYAFGEIGTVIPRSITWGAAVLSMIALSVEAAKGSRDKRRAQTPVYKK